MTRAQSLRWEASGLSSEAKRHRAAAQAMRRERQRLNERPMIQRDPIKRLRLLSEIHERQRIADGLEARAKELRELAKGIA